MQFSTTPCRATQAEIYIFDDDGVEAAIESDRRFFKRFKNRKFYVRPASLGEIEALGEPTPPPGHMWFAIVRQFAPGFRARRWGIGPIELMLDEQGEVCSEQIWNQFEGQSFKGRDA